MLLIFWAIVLRQREQCQSLFRTIPDWTELPLSANGNMHYQLRRTASGHERGDAQIFRPAGPGTAVAAGWLMISIAARPGVSARRPFQSGSKCSRKA